MRTNLRLQLVSGVIAVRARFGRMLSTGTASASEKKIAFLSLRTRAVPAGVSMHLDCEHPPVKEVLSNIHCVALYIKSELPKAIKRILAFDYGLNVIK